jgi:hypothetical protein
VLDIGYRNRSTICELLSTKTPVLIANIRYPIFVILLLLAMLIDNGVLLGHNNKMKYILSALFSIIVFSLGGQALAQQQDGVTASDLQPQVSGSQIQQNQQSQQTSPVTDNAGANTLQNLPNQEISVEGQTQPVPEEIESSPRWILLSIIFFGILLSPALLFVRDMKNKGQLESTPKAKPSKQPAAKAKAEIKKAEPKQEPVSEPVQEEHEDSMVEEPTAESESKEDKSETKPKKKKKKNSSKVKRGKKKK